MFPIHARPIADAFNGPTTKLSYAQHQGFTNMLKLLKQKCVDDGRLADYPVVPNTKEAIQNLAHGLTDKLQQLRINISSYITQLH